MNSIQTNTSDEALVIAIRANLCALFRYMSQAMPGIHAQKTGAVSWHTPLQHPWFNGVLSAQTTPSEEEGLITEAARYFRAQGTRTFTWWLEPPLKAEDWQATFSHHGFGFSNDTPGMAVDLQELNPQTEVVGLEIRLVNDPDTLRTWAEVFTHGYGLPPTWAEAIFDVWLKLGLDGPVKNYLGYLNGEPVATATMFYGAGVAGIYDVATLTEARGKGVGSALTLYPLQVAREAGYRVGILQSSEKGFSVYRRLGFRHLCQIENFYLSLSG